METRRKIKDNKEDSLCEEEASVHAVTLMEITLTWQTGTWRERCSKQWAGILILEKLRTPEITSSVPVDAAEGHMAKGKRRTTAKGVTWGVSAKESNFIDLVGLPVSRGNSANQEVRCADKGETDNAGQPP